MLLRKKWTALCTALLAGTMFVTGCGGDSAKSDSGKEENVLVIYNCNTDDWTAPLVKEFQEKTGIEVQLVAGGSGELLGRVKAEKDNPLGDVIWGGVRDSYVGLKPYLMPYASTEKAAIQDQFLEADDTFYNDVADFYVLAYNTDLVSDADAPKGWKDLTDPKWKGKIAMADPAKSSTSYTVLLMAREKLGGNMEVVDQLVGNLDGKIISGSAAQIKALSDGEYSITATFEEPVVKYMTNGSHMKIVYPEEGTVLSTGCVGIIKGAKHTENAKKFIDFVMSKEVQTRIGDFSRRSTRKDVPAPAQLKPADQITYEVLDVDLAVKEREALLGRWRQAVTK